MLPYYIKYALKCTDTTVGTTVLPAVRKEINYLTGGFLNYCTGNTCVHCAGTNMVLLVGRLK